MEKLYVEGKRGLRGELVCHGAKNSVLPILAACAVTGQEVLLHNCPALTDVDISLRILAHLGCECRRGGNDVAVDAGTLCCAQVPQPLMLQMRSSIVFLGALTARCGEACLTYPGGCDLGARPIDLHLDALRALGAQVTEEHGLISCSAPEGLRGASIALYFPSVGATENILIAASRARGRTVLTNAAQEPEVVDLARFLNACGANISGAGESTIVIEGVEDFHPCEFTVMPDRIEAVTFLAAAAITGSVLTVHKTDVDSLRAVLPIFLESGCQVTCQGDSVSLRAPERLNGVKMIRTMPYPGFSTDAQALVMAMLATAKGTSVFVENIFENRYKHAYELNKMGANIKTEGRMAVVEGVEGLTSCPVTATDLRSGAALLVAGLAAEGVTEIGHIFHIRRGYQSLWDDLNSVGAKIEQRD